jgi:hypothetical protein
LRCKITFLKFIFYCLSPFIQIWFNLLIFLLQLFYIFFPIYKWFCFDRDVFLFLILNLLTIYLKSLLIKILKCWI